MPHVPVDPLVPSTSIDDLRNAVARWDYEGGADVTGPQEGYRIDGRSVGNALVCVTFDKVDADAGGEQLDRLVRLLLAASTIRDERWPLNANVASK